MTILTIPLRHARTKWLRTLLLTAVFTLGITSMSGLYLVSSLVSDSFEKKLLSYGANILITPKQEILQISYGGYALGDIALEQQTISISKSLANIDEMPLRANVAVVAPKMLAVTRINDTPVALVGVVWKEELSLKGYWEVTGTFPNPKSTNEILVGAKVASTLGLSVGQVLDVSGQPLKVAGILLPTGSDDDAVLFAPLSVAQDLSGKPGQAAFLEVAALCAGCPIEDIVSQLQSALPSTEVRALRQVAESRMYAVHFAQNLAFYVSLVILVTACAMIVMSMLSAVAERRKEIGIMRAVGFSRTGVFIVFVVEALGIGLAAGLIGALAGHSLAGNVLAQLHLAETASHSFNYGFASITVAAAGVLSALAAAFPAWKASLVEPAEALVAL